MNHSMKRYLKNGYALIRTVLCMVLIMALMTGCGSSSSKLSDSLNCEDVDYAYDASGSGDGGEVGMIEEEISEDFSYQTVASNGSDNSGVTKDSASNQDGNEGESGDSDYSQKLIYTYYFDFETTTYAQSIAFINESVTKYHGYIQNSSEYGTENHYSNITIRIPAEHADEFLAETGSIGTITSKEVTTEDITLQYFDLKAHIETLNTQRNRLLELLEKAKSVSDITKIQNQLSEVEYEINSYTTQMKVYDNQVDYVTIHLNIQEVNVITPTESDNFITRVKNGLSNNTADVMNSAVEFAIWLIVMLPYFIVIGVLVAIAIFIVMLLKKRNLAHSSDGGKKRRGWSGKKKDADEVAESGKGE